MIGQAAAVLIICMSPSTFNVLNFSCRTYIDLSLLIDTELACSREESSLNGCRRRVGFSARRVYGTLSARRGSVGKGTCKLQRILFFRVEFDENRA